MVHPDHMKKVKMVHPFLDWEGVGADLWKIVANFMDGRTLVRLSLASRGWGKFILQDNLLWKNACFKFVGIPVLDHSDLNWKEIYANLHKFRVGNPVLVGGIFVEETSLIATAQLDITGLNALLEEGKGSKGTLFTNVRNGMWIVNQFSDGCVDQDHKCGRYNITLEACAVHYYMSEEYAFVEWDKEVVYNAPSTSVDCGIFVPTRLSDPSSVEVATPSLWGWENIWEISSKRTPYAVMQWRRLKELLINKRIGHTFSNLKLMMK